jgi:hypothetical protein
MMLQQPSHSQDLAPWGFFLFSTMKNNLEGSHFEITDKIQKVTTDIQQNLQENGFWK